MTPRLAGFIAIRQSRDDAAAGMREDPVAAALAALGESFTLVPERGGTPPPASRAGRVPQRDGRDGRGGRAPRRHTWLDTFDWRLYRAGLVLEYVQEHRGGELRLAERQNRGAGQGSGPDGSLAVQPVAGWRSARPHLAGDLPDGPVTDHVAGFLGPRALVPLVTVAMDETVTRLLNEDGKTVARLLVEYPALVGAASLAPRLAVREVRGYSAAARQAGRIVRETPGFVPAECDLLTEALAASGRRPGDYTSKVNADITARMPSGRAVAVILLRLLDMAEANVPGVLHDIDTEFLHDFRVAVRRTRAALKLFGGAFGRQVEVARFASEFKWLGDITTPIRDLDVHLLGFEDMAGNLKAGKADDLEPFRDYLRGRRAREQRALARALRSPRFRELTRDWRAALISVRDRGEESAGRGGGQPKLPGTSAATFAAETTRKAFGKVTRRGGAITGHSPPEALHDLRKRCKELRYALEFFAPLYVPAQYGRVIGDLKGLQDCLGAFQDSVVQISEIRSLGAAMLAENEAPAVTLLAMGEITAGLVDGQAAARADFGRRFGEFAGIQGRRRMSALLRSTTPGNE